MRKKSRRSRHENLFNSFTCNITSDKNRIFCIRQCIIYTGRLMHCLPILDQETLDFIQWLIPDENENIVQIVIGMLSKKEKAFFSDEIPRSPLFIPRSHRIIYLTFIFLI